MPKTTTQSAPKTRLSLNEIERLSHDLWFAAQGGARAQVSKLLEQGANPNHRGDFERTPLIAAAIGGNTRVFPALVKGGADILATAGKGGANALDAACQHGQAESVVALLRLHPLAVWRKGRERWLLNIAAQNGHPDTLSALLPIFVEQEILPPPGPALPASPTPANLRDAQGRTPLFDAATSGDRNAEATSCVNALLPFFSAADRDQQGMTVLLAAAESRWANSVQTLKLLVSAGCDPRATDNAGRTALMLATNAGKLDSFKFFLPLSDALAADHEGHTALMAAVTMTFRDTPHYQSGVRLDCLRALLPVSDANAVNAKGQTALGIAMATLQEHERDKAEVLALLSRSMDASQKNANGKTPFEEATDTQSWPVVDALAATATDGEFERLLLALVDQIGPSARARAESLLLKHTVALSQSPTATPSGATLAKVRRPGRRV